MKETINGLINRLKSPFQIKVFKIVEMSVVLTDFYYKLI